LRDVELILAARGIVVSYESIREWGLRFGRIFANALERRRSQPGDTWYMDEVFIRVRASNSIFGARSTRTKMSATLWFSAGATQPRPPVLSQAAEGLALCSAGDRHRQAQELRRGTIRNFVRGGAVEPIRP
jgi:putative transposase